MRALRCAVTLVRPRAFATPMLKAFMVRRCFVLRGRRRKTPKLCFATCAQNGFEPAHADINFTRWVATDASYELSDTHELCAFGFPCYTL